MNLTTFTSAQVHLTNPAGQSVPITAKIAAGSTGNQIEIDFALQTAPGKYTLSLGTGVHDSAGAALAAYSVTDAFTPAQFVFTSAKATPIPDPGTATSTITVSQDITISSLQVTLNISQTFDSDLFIFLQAPDGTEVLLVNRRGGSGATSSTPSFPTPPANRSAQARRRSRGRTSRNRRCPPLPGRTPVACGRCGWRTRAAATSASSTAGR